MGGQVLFLAVEAEDITSFGEKCTPKVEKAIPKAVKMVLQELNVEHS
jgi:Ni,Fe-hydrogenase maturation factor